VHSALIGGLQGGTVVINQPRFILGSRAGRQNWHEKNENEEPEAIGTGKIYSGAVRLSTKRNHVDDRVRQLSVFWRIVNASPIEFRCAKENAAL
jgi:hypothetical protein